MKNIIAVTIVSFVLVVTGASAFAEGERRLCKQGKKDAADKMALMKTMLDLSEEQVNQITDIRSEHREEMKAHIGDQERLALTNLDPTSSEYQETVAARAKMKAEKVEARILGKAELKAKIFTVLTPEQQEKFIAFQEDRRAFRDREIMH